MENKPKCTIDKYRTKRWVMNGQHHRLDGPATIDRDGNGIQWYCHNQNIEKWLKLNNIDIYNPTDVDILLIKLTFGFLDEKTTKNLINNLNHS